MPVITRRQAQQQRLQTLTHSINASGDHVMVGPSATGLGTRTVWVYPENEVSSHAPTAVTSLSSLSSLSDSISSIETDPRPTTPPPRGSWAANSVLETPKKLQRSPNRIGGHGVDIWRDGSGVVVQKIVGADGVEREAGGSGSPRAEADVIKTKLAIAKREKELISMMANLGSRTAQVRGDVFAGRSATQASGQRLGPEGTFLVSEDSTDSDTEMEDDSESDLDARQERCNRRGRRLGVEPTIILRPGRYEPPVRAEVSSAPSAQRLGPEDTFQDSTDSDTEMEDDSDLDARQERCNRRARRLGVEPTIILRPGSYQPPVRPAPRRRRQTAKPLGLQPTEPAI